MGCGSSVGTAEKMKDLEKIKEHSEDIIKHLEDLERKLKGFTEDLKSCSEEYQDKKDICIEMYTEMKNLFEESKKARTVLHRNNKLLTEEEDSSTTKDFSQIIPVDIYIFEKGSGDEIKQLRAKLIEMLEDAIKNSNYQMNVIPCSDLSKVRTEIPLLVLCVAATRVGSDAEEAIKGVPNLSKTLLLIFHPQSYPVREVTSSKLVLTDEQFRNLGGIHDFIYNAEKNVIYSCKTNKSALNSVVDFVGNFVGNVLTVHL